VDHVSTFDPPGVTTSWRVTFFSRSILPDLDPRRHRPAPPSSAGSCPYKGAVNTQQEGFLAAFRRLPKMHDDVAFSSWLHRNVVWAAGMQSQRAHWRREFAGHTREVETGYDEFEQQERRATAIAALQSLPASAREAVVLRFYLDLSELEVGRLRNEMARLPEQPGPNELVTPWNAREGLLYTGARAAIDLERWQEALALLDEEVESKRRRGAGSLDVARTRLKAYFPLLRLGRLIEAHELLLECQQVFSQENDIRRLGKVLGARADLEDELGRLAEAVELQERALRYLYLAGDVAGIAGSHFNLADYLGRAGRRPDALPHRLAAALIWFQTESGELVSRLTALSRDLAETAAPTSFAEVCAAVERVEGVRFRELFAALPQRAGSADDALAQVLALARQQAHDQ
jgi:tetratricopeptide (TPR) repeat protein